MATLYNADLNTLQPGEYTHPYDHATKLFVGDNYRLAPKQSFLYYVVINLDTSQNQFGGALGSLLNFADRFQRFESGLLVKRIELPKFTINTKTLNSYNRKNIVQTNIQYDPVSVTFHDDAADVVTNFWNDYYTYHYRDSDYNAEGYRQPFKYSTRTKVGWGYNPHNGGVTLGSSNPIYSFIKNIRIFSLHNKRFTEYLLVNPVITAWRHGEHESGNNTGIMENSMTVTYETVKYFTGYVNPVNVDGFSLLYYDNTNSPISNSVTNIYSDAGLVGAIAGAPRDLAKPEAQFGAGGPLSNLLSMYRTYNNLKNVNLQTVVGTTLGQVGAQVLNNTLNNGLNYAFPSLSGGFGGTGSTQIYNNNTTGASGVANPSQTAAITIGGAAAGAVSGAAINTTNQAINQVTSSVNRGITTTLSGPLPDPNSTRVYDVQGNNGIISLTPALQPVTGSTTAVILNDQGEIISQFQTTGSQSGTYNQSNPLENLKSVQTTADESNNIIVVRTYNDGTQVTEDADGNQLGVYPGAINNSKNINVNPQNSRTLAMNGTPVPPSSPQYYTNPRTGVTYTVGGSTSAQITNALSGAAGSAAGLYAGQSLNSALNNTALGKSVIGRTLSAAASTATGAAIGRAVNNGLQPIVNSVTGQISQGWDSFTGQIKNVVGSWTGSGGYNVSKPLDNIVAKTVDVNGSNVYTYKDGTIRTVDAEGVQTVTPGSNNSGLFSWNNGASGQNKDAAAVSAPPGSIWTDGSGNPIESGTGDYIYEGDPTLSPRAITDSEWEQMDLDNQAAIDNMMTDYPVEPGTDFDPVQSGLDLNGFEG